MFRTRAVWQNWPGAPGYTNLYFLSADNANHVESFFDAIKGLLPLGLQVTVPSGGDVVEDSSGQITAAWDTPGSGGVVTSTAGSASYPGAAGAVVNWLTNSFAGGRRVRGKSFLVPLTGASFSSSGDLQGTTVTTIQTAATGLITASAGDLCVWHRPTAFSAGSSHTVTSATVPDLSAVLRSRRR